MVMPSEALVVIVVPLAVIVPVEYIPGDFVPAGASLSP